MFIQIHALQSFPPGNLNRDDQGHPKSALFGGVTRGRISSQCMKRLMRRSDVFATLRNGVAYRTRRLPTLVGDALKSRGVSGLDAAAIAKIEARIAAAFKKEAVDSAAEASKEGILTGQLVFFPQRFVDDIATLVADAAKGDSAALTAWLEDGAKTEKASKKGSKGDGDGKKAEKASLLEAAIREASHLITIDIGMFGRMTTSDLVEDVEAACQVAHSISTHEVRIERDYFTAMDDLADAKGAGYIGGGDSSTYFNSAVYYRYLNLDLAQLRRNVRVAGAMQSEGILSDTEVADAACALLNAVVHAGPTAKQNSFAAHSVPEFLIFEISSRRQPLSYANAFLEAVDLGGDGSLMSRSATRLRCYVRDVAARFEPSDLRRFALALGDAACPQDDMLAGATMVERYADLERLMRESISAPSVAGAR
jgi:CRISPR system Cascade subunit CasC